MEVPPQPSTCSSSCWPHTLSAGKCWEWPVLHRTAHSPVTGHAWRANDQSPVAAQPTRTGNTTRVVVKQWEGSWGSVPQQQQETAPACPSQRPPNPDPWRVRNASGRRGLGGEKDDIMTETHSAPAYSLGTGSWGPPRGGHGRGKQGAGEPGEPQALVSCIRTDAVRRPPPEVLCLPHEPGISAR